MALTLRRLAAELGLATVLGAPRDVHLILLARFLRMAAYGAASLVLALLFAALGFSDARIGLFLTLTLLGDVALSLLLTLGADAAGRRRVLLVGCAGMALAGAAFALAGAYWLLLAAAVLGVVSVSGSEIGPFRAVEESVLAGLVGGDDDDGARSDVFVWYVVVGTLGSAVGLAGGGWLVEGLKARGWAELEAFRAVFWVYASVGVVKGAVTALLSERCEVDGGGGSSRGYQPIGARGSGPVVAVEGEEGEDGDGDDEEGRPSRQPAPNPPPPPAAPASKPKMGFAQLSSQTRWTLLRLCALFAVDSLASGMVPYSLVNFYLDRKFHLPKSALGGAMSAVWVASSVGNVLAAPLARRVGLVRTMVFTHLPSAVFLALLPAPRGAGATVALLLARGALASMDQAPRSAFLSRVVAPGERTAVMGVVNVVKTLSQSGGPSVTGWLAGEGRFWVAFVVAGAMKASYDLGLLTFFLKVERQAGGSSRREGEGQGEREGLGDEQVEDLGEAFELASDDEDDDLVEHSGTQK